MHSENPNETTPEAQPESADAQAYRASLAAEQARFAEPDPEAQLFADIAAGNGSAVGITPDPRALPAWAPPVGPVQELDPMASLANLSEEEKWAAAEAPARAPQDYRLPPPHRDFGDPTPESLAEAEGLRALLHASALPATEGEAIMYEIAQAAARTPEPPDDATFELQMQQTHAQLRRAMGDSEFNRCQAALEKLHADLTAKNPALADYLDDHAHLLAAPLVLHRLLVHAGRGVRR